MVQAVECHPDPDVRKHCFIGMLVMVLITLNFLHSERPKLLRVLAFLSAIRLRLRTAVIRVAVVKGQTFWTQIRLLM